MDILRVILPTFSTKSPLLTFNETVLSAVSILYSATLAPVRLKTSSFSPEALCILTLDPLTLRLISSFCSKENVTSGCSFVALTIWGVKRKKDNNNVMIYFIFMLVLIFTSTNILKFYRTNKWNGSFYMILHNTFWFVLKIAGHLNEKIDNLKIWRFLTAVFAETFCER